MIRKKIFRYAIEWLVFDIVSYIVWLTYDDWIWALATVFLGYLLYRLVILKSVVAMIETMRKRKAMTSWVNEINTQLLNSSSLGEAIAKAIETNALGEDIKVQLESESNLIASIEPLVYYFNRPYYTMFHYLLESMMKSNICSPTLISPLIIAINREETDFHSHLAIHHKHLKELSFGWALTIAMIIYIKTALPAMYLMQLNSNQIKYSVASVWVILLLSSHFFFRLYQPLSTNKGWDTE